MTRRALAAAPVATVVSALAALALPATVLGHQLSATFESRLPLAVYLSGAGAAVALSFAFVLVRDVRAEPPVDDGARRSVPGWIRLPLRALGLLGWLWIVAQTIAGGDSDAEVIRLFTWVYGWVGVALVCALVGPVWRWLDPFSTLHDLLARGAGALGIGAMEPATYPERAGRWPAAIAFGVLVWLELVVGGAGTRTLGILILGYTLLTLAMMAQFGKDTWRQNGEVFSVWFGLLGRLAPLAPAGPSDDNEVRPRGFATGLLEGGFTLPDLVMIGLGTGSILFDGLSQTVPWVRTFGLPGPAIETVQLAVFMALIVGAALVVARLVGIDATGAGFLPIAVGYLLAHYLTYLLIEGQRIVIAVSDPLQQGWDLFGTAFYQQSGAWLPPALVWTVQLAAVVGGHMIGAWAGHVVAARRSSEERSSEERSSEDAATPLVAAELPAEGGPTSPSSVAVASSSRERSSSRELRLRQVPLAAVMVGLTTLTLWSLGQAIFVATAQ